MEIELKKARFTFDEDEDFPIFRGWYDPQNRYWNGWCNPYFDKHTRNCFIALQKSYLDEMHKGKAYNEQDQEFFDGLLSIEPQEINGKELYYFGGFYCWTEMDTLYVEEEDY